jgi:YVTN family beta-propeller protein
MFTAAANAATSNPTVVFTGNSGALTHTKNLSLTVNGNNGPPVRTRYVRTDATTIYSTWLNQHWEVYDPSTSRFFVTDPFSNHVFVLDDTTESEIASIGVPGAYGIDEAPDHRSIYVGTVIGDVYVINPVTMAVTQRYMSSQIGPEGFQSWVALALADGRLALLGPPGGIPSVDLPTSYALWDPTDNSISICNVVACGGGGISGFTTSVDRTKLITGANEITEVDIATGQVISSSDSANADHILTSPDGKYIILWAPPSDAVVYDAVTLEKISDFTVAGEVGSDSSFAVSADSSTLYTPGEDHGGFVYAYSLPTGKAVGWVPDMIVIPQGGGGAVGPIMTPYLLAVDGTGLFAGPLEEGVGFVDVSALQTGAGATQFENGYLIPTTGPVSGGTATQNADPNPVGPLQSVYFGSQQATNLSLGPGFAINATSPPGSAGYVDVYNFTTGIYDSYRDLYYFTDSNQIQVFSRTQGKWLSPIAVPPPQGATQRLWGIALSPNGSKVAVSDIMAGVIYLLDPTNWTSVKTFAVGAAGNSHPSGVAVSDLGWVYFVMYGGVAGYFKLDTNTGTITEYLTEGGGGTYLRSVITSDNTTVFFNNMGYLVSVDTATDNVTFAAVIPFCCGADNELALSNNQVQLLSSSYIYDTDLNAESFYALNDREIQYTSYVYGAKMSADGRLVFQPSTNGIDVLDGRLGNLLQRVSLPVSLSTNYDALVEDGTDNVLIAVIGEDGTGVAVVDLTSIVEPPPLPYAKNVAPPGHRLVKGARGRDGEQLLDRRPMPIRGTQQRTVPHITHSPPRTR